MGGALLCSGIVSPRKHDRDGPGGSRAEALRPRRGGRRDAEHLSVDAWTGRRRLWPKANRRRRGGQGGAAPCGFFPLFLGRPRNRAACRGGTRQLRRSMSGKSKPAVGRPPTNCTAPRAANSKKPISPKTQFSYRPYPASAGKSPRRARRPSCNIPRGRPCRPYSGRTARARGGGSLRPLRRRRF